MKKYFAMWFFILLSLVALSEPTNALEHQISSISELNKAYSRALQNLIDHTGLFKSGSDYFYDALYSKDPLLKRFQSDVAEKVKKINEARSRGASQEELVKLQLEYQKAKLMENKQLVALVESNLYNSIDYVVSESLKGSLETATKVINDVLSNWRSILEPLLEGDFGGVIKNAILQLIDSTYKVTFIDYCKNNYGATDKIANYWWKTYFVEPFQNSEEKKLLDKVLTKASDDLKEKLKSKLTERLKLVILNKGGELTKDAIEETVKNKAEGILKNLIETPSLIVELFVKYYNVADFQLMFNDLATNEIFFIKQIRELVGNDESEINRCYFDKAYFLEKKKQSLNKQLPDMKPHNSTKSITTKEEIIPEEITEKIQKTISKEDPALEISTVESIEKQLETMNSSLPGEIIPFPDKSEQLIEELFAKLENDEISLGAYKAEAQQVISLYSSSVALAKNKILESLKAQYEKGELSYDEYSNRKKEVVKKVDKYIAAVSDRYAKFELKIKDAQSTFKKQFFNTVSSVDIGNEIRNIDSTMNRKIEDFKKLYHNKTGQYVPQYTVSVSFTQMINAFSNENNGFGKSFVANLYSNSPSVFLLEHGSWIVENLLALFYEENQLIQNLLDSTNKLWEELLTLFDNVPKYYYTNESGENLLVDGINSIQSLRNSLLNRLQALMNWESPLSDWTYLLEEKNAKTKIYLEAYLVFQQEKVELFNEFLQRLTDDFDSLEVRYLEAWRTDRIEGMCQTLVNMWHEKITPDTAKEKLKLLALSTKDVDAQYQNWLQLREDLSQLSNEINSIKNDGVSLLNLAESQVTSNYMKALIEKNEKLKNEASQSLKNYEKASLDDYRHDLIGRIRDFSNKIVDFENYPDDLIRGERAYYIRILIRNAGIQKEGMSYPLSFDNPYIAGATNGNLEMALKLCESFRDFLKEAETRSLAKNEANKVMEKFLDDIEPDVEKIVAKGNFITRERKEELLSLLDEAHESAIETIKSYGVDTGYDFYFAREEEIRRKIENMVVREAKTGAQPSKEGGSFHVIEKPTKLVQDEIIWLDVMNKGYPGYRFSMSPDGEKLLIELQANTSADKRFRLYNLAKHEFEQLVLPSKATEIISSGGYNFNWTADNELYIYSYDGKGVIITDNGNVEDKPITTITGVALYGSSSSGEFILARELYGKIYLLKSDDASYRNIGTSYKDKALQWIPGTDMVFFIDESNMVNVYDAQKDSLSTYQTLFDGYVCAVLPGGKWFVFGEGFELKAMKIDGSEITTLLRLEESSLALIAGVYPLYGNNILVLWMNHGDKFDYGVQVCTIE
ncbi:hypothetical protein AT15_05815 [Kosmotoga arenicorallina S304]|uniref:Uncharacterized protein n=1 Tax=Kosmotoga arenicorallina S304 TaxID=1453497 RepID=A0A176K2S2_9BACT|nr:hypothetical protein [Kosmotoga arenicorallina]OAA31590.1 hypothetical protein AT15_05815 [Kosmotoga arenicorallina S304]